MSNWANVIRLFEMEHGNTLITDAPWLNRNEWHEIVVSKDKEGRIRLVLLDALLPRHGALTRLIAGIQREGLVPVIVEPLGYMLEWCKKHGWRSRVIGKGTDTQKIWYPRP